MGTLHAPLIAPINKIIPFSAVDGPGNRTAIFFQRCNFNCLYCHNPETINLCINCGKCVAGCPTKALSISPSGAVCFDKSLCCDCDECIKTCPYSSSPKVSYMTTDELISEIEKNMPFINGITVSGGECTLWHEYLAELFEKAHALGLTTFVDSNGLIPFVEMPNLLTHMDKAMLDIKAYDNDEHIMLVNAENQNIIENIQFLAELDKLYEIRTVVVPEIIDNRLTVDMASKLIAPYKNTRYKLIKFRQNGVRADLLTSRTPTDTEMDTLASIAKENGVSDIVIV